MLETSSDFCKGTYTYLLWYNHKFITTTTKKSENNSCERINEQVKKRNSLPVVWKRQRHNSKELNGNRVWLDRTFFTTQVQSWNSEENSGRGQRQQNNRQFYSTHQRNGTKPRNPGCFLTLPSLVLFLHHLWGFSGHILKTALKEGQDWV